MVALSAHLTLRLPVLRLRSHLAALLVAAMLLTFTLVLAGLLALQVPRIEAESRRAQQREVGEMRARIELLLQARTAQLALLASQVDAAPPALANAILDAGVGAGGNVRAIYRLSPRGEVIAAGLPPDQRHLRADLLGNDMSAHSLFRAAVTGDGVAWQGNHVSMLNGQAVVGAARRDARGDVLIAELPLHSLLGTVRVAAGAHAAAVWVVDRSGEIIADSRGGRDVGRLNIRNWPLMQDLLQGRAPASQRTQDGASLRVAVSHSPALDWYFISQRPSGLADPRVRELVLPVLAALAGSLAIALLIAPYWARRMASPLDRIIDRADRSASGENDGRDWPRGPVAEFNRLAADLEAMTAALRARERKSLAIFHASPVPMAVSDIDDDYRLLDVNEAWCTEFCFRREDVLQRTSQEIGLWVDSNARLGLRRQAEQGATVGDVRLRRRDGSTLLAQVYGRPAVLPSARLMIWAIVDVGPVRSAEQELRELNQQLEDRVRSRTEALATSNAELSQTVEQLRSAQHELVRSEKMAALGSLVAGVAHELNTPLGNGVMAVSAMADATRTFRAAAQAGLRRSDLQQMLESLEQGTDIAGRNLRRAAELVQSFKQVAVDQTSAQRRSFELGEVVHEMVVSLKPSFARRPWRIEVDVPASGLRLDSYPGALGQVLGNLIQNAVLHGFEGREQGTVCIAAGRIDAQWVWLRVADDGRGIAAEHIDRVFEPFMTTKVGRGGTGLGLHISHNAVVDLLGGTLTVRSGDGEGACFEMRLPAQAPRDATQEDGHGGAADQERRT